MLKHGKAAYVGFTLIEMALVLLVLTLLLGSLLVPLSTQVEQRQIAETQKTLEEVKEALIGFAIVNRRLPRPAVSFNDGTERPSLCATVPASVPAAEALCTGFIPWTTLGVRKLDGWGKIFRYSVTPAFANGSITTSTIATKQIQTRDVGGALIYIAGSVTCSDNNCIPAVIFSHGRNNWGTSDAGNIFADSSGTNLDEDTNNAATVVFISRASSGSTTASGGEFDDIVSSLSRYGLIGRMGAAGPVPP